MRTTLFIISLIYFTLCNHNTYGWGSTTHKKILLKDVYTLTLQDGKMTNSRRSSPVPQLECVNEGSASCHNFKPRIVQCTNRGSDGIDAQWECKCDMDSRYKFGFIEVNCEGYEYPDDPYVLAGSCGLRYTLDEASGGSSYGSSYGSYKKSNTMSYLADLITYAGIALMIYALYKTCFRPDREVGDNSYSSTNDDYPNDNSGGGRGYGWFGGNNSSDNTNSRSYSSDDASCSRNRGTRQQGSGLGGFWTGAATGGLLGYMFGGGRNSGYGNYGYGGNSYGYGGRSYGSGGMFSGGSGGSYSSGSSTSTGFGGTSRR